MSINAPQDTPRISHQTRPVSPPAPGVTPTEVVEALHDVFGRTRGARAIHAKGVVFEGQLMPSPSAAALSKAPHLQQAPSSVVVRFSNFSGAPTTGDLEPTASPRGMAIKIMLRDGSTTDIVAHSFNGFPTSNVEDFRSLFIALRASPPGGPSPSPLETFFRDHPAAKAFLSAPNPPPSSYGTLPYYGINSFSFVNREGTQRFGRYRIDPCDGTQFLTAEEKLVVGDSYLAAATRARVQRAPIAFTLGVQLSEPGDVIEDPSLVWPESRQVVPLGMISITRTIDESDTLCKALSFDPAALPDGIEIADPMIRARSAAYLVSQQQRMR